MFFGLFGWVTGMSWQSVGLETIQVWLSSEVGQVFALVTASCMFAAFASRRFPHIRTWHIGIQSYFLRQASIILSPATAAVRNWRVIAGLVILVLALLIALKWFWNQAVDFVRPATAEERNDLLTTVAQILGGLALAAGAVFTFRSLQVTREGQVTERFTRAIDHVGSEHPSRVVGGIYALERIAHDSARDHGAIMAVLAAIVRQTATRSTDRRDALEAWVLQRGPLSNLPALLDSKGSNSNEAVQAALTVLGRRIRTPDRETVLGLDLSGTDLHFVTTTGSYLAGFNFFGADLEQAVFAYSNFDKAILTLAVVRQATFERASFREADLDLVLAVDASFLSADLDQASFREGRCQGATFDRAILTEVSFNGAVLEGASFESATLTNAKFTGASLAGASFKDAVLTQADFRGVDLRRVEALTGQQMAAAKVDQNTKLPEYLLDAKS